MPLRILPVLLLMLVAALSSVRAQTAEPAEVKVSFRLLDLKVPLREPDWFWVRFNVGFHWKAGTNPALPLDHISFAGEREPLKIVRVKSTKANGSPGLELVVEGWLNSGADYRAYPFDSHELPVMMAFPQLARDAVRWNFQAEHFDVLSHAKTARYDGWIIDGINAYSPDDMKFGVLPLMQGSEEPSSHLAFTIDVRRPQAHVIMELLVPALVIWLASYFGFFWKDSSPASRAGMSAMFAAVAFTLTSRNVMPDVNYVTILSLIYLILFVQIALTTVLVTMSFYANERGREALGRRLRKIGMIACPILALVFIVLVFVLCRTAPYDSFMGVTPSATRTFQ